MLLKAGLAIKVHHTAAQGLPLEAQAKLREDAEHAHVSQSTRTGARSADIFGELLEVRKNRHYPFVRSLGDRLMGMTARRGWERRRARRQVLWTVTQSAGWIGTAEIPCLRRLYGTARP